MKIKRLLTLLLVSVALTASFAGCDKEPSASYPEGKPDIHTEKEMFVGGFFAPVTTEENYKNIAECGINNMIIQSNYSAGSKSNSYSDPKFRKDPFDLGEKYGIKIIPNTDNQAWSVFTNFAKDWNKSSAFGGINVFDEPSVTDFPLLKKELKTFKEKCPDKPYHINLFPYYATSAQLGADTYDEYVRLFTEELLMEMDEGNRYLISDIYPLLKQGQLYGNWLNNLEILRKYADQADSELYIYIQSISFSNRRQPTSAGDLRMQAYVSMAYGATGIYHFTYQTPYYDSGYAYSRGCVDKEGNKTDVYEYAKIVNHELLALDEVYLDFKWKAAVSSVGSKNLTGENLNFNSCSDLKNNYGILKSLSSEQDTLVGCFENEDGYQGFIAVNFTDPSLKKSGKAVMEFDGGVNKALVYVGGEKTECDITEGRLELSLGAGDGVFVVPYKV